MPGLIRGMARTAAVVGTATATRNAVNRRQANKNVQAYSNAVNQAYPQQQQPQYVMSPSGAQPDYIVQAPPMEAPPPVEAPIQEDVITQLALSPGHPDRRGVRGPEGQAARHVRLHPLGQPPDCQWFNFFQVKMGWHLHPILI
jgi:hypothetical protein